MDYAIGCTTFKEEIGKTGNGTSGEGSFWYLNSKPAFRRIACKSVEAARFYSARE